MPGRRQDVAWCSRCGQIFSGYVGQLFECDCYKRCPACKTLMVPFTQTPNIACYQGEARILFECPKCHTRSSLHAVEVEIT